MRTRDRYIDFLRALALVRVITFHTFGWVWLPAVFPSIGIMFALGGALVTASLDRAASVPDFWRKRFRRLLPPFWVFGATMLVVMFAAGWTADGGFGVAELTWRNAWLWVFPLADPQASDLGADWALPLWYIRTYLWFLLISPALLWLFRRWPVRTMVVPAVVLPLMTLGLIDFADPYWDIIATLCTYGICWMLGFAHHDGTIRDLPLGTTILVGVALMAGGLYFALSQQERYGSWNVDDNPLAGLLYFTGAVLILLRLYRRMDWLGRLPTLDAIISLINSRAMTIYLWGNFAIFLAPYALEYTGLGQFDGEDTLGLTVEFAVAWALIFVAVLLVGWVEDVAAGKRPRLLPFNRVKAVTVVSEQPASAPAAAAVEPALHEGPRSSYGNFVVDTGRAGQPAPNGHPRGGTVVLAERPVELADLDVEDDSPEAVGAPSGRAADVRANFVIDEVGPEEAEALEGVQAGPERTRVADPANPTPIVVHVEEAGVVLDPPVAGKRGDGRPGSDAP
ncbi:MAG: Peptidoglycan/LPS O-acetylase OafA/YrhL, contains acyltransferase and SGNH-hydrolase domain [Modestobacter sp.]|jgi:peptidoglycan/LPS O-acetylase OafA/YrhL|nr:Peptidoglycan/LPS O-acetylase OafA/YrhL, contains acyltransferase and SGNH-hydrolase domain [Modestobacter sp.]